MPLRLPCAMASLGFQPAQGAASLALTHIAGKCKIYAWKSDGSFWGFDFRCTTDFTFPRAGWKPWVGKGTHFWGELKRAGVLLRGFEADSYIFKQISQYLIKSVQLYLHPVCNIWDLSRGALQCGLMPVNAACLKHARGNGRQYCVLKHARNASIPLGGQSWNARPWNAPNSTLPTACVARH